MDGDTIDKSVFEVSPHRSPHLVAFEGSRIAIRRDVTT